MYTCVIINSDENSNEILINIAKQDSRISNLLVCKDELSALSEVENIDLVDVLILDTDISGISGLRILELVKSKTRKVIFIAHCKKYAWDAFEAEVDFYILKQFLTEKFPLALNKVLTACQAENYGVGNGYFFVKSKYDQNMRIKIKFRDILAVEASLNYMTIYTALKNITVYMTLSSLKKILFVYDNFIQIHKSFVVNLNKVDVVGNNYIQLENKLRLPIGYSFKKKLKSFLNQTINIENELSCLQS